MRYAIVYQASTWIDDLEIEEVHADSETDAINQFLEWTRWKTKKPILMRCVQMERTEAHL